MDMSLSKLREIVKDGEDGQAAVAKSRTWLSQWTTMTSTAPVTKEKISQTYSNLKLFSFNEYHQESKNTTHRMLKKSCKAHTYKWLLCIMYKDILELKNKKTTQFLKYGQRVWINISSKQIYQWPISIFAQHQFSSVQFGRSVVSNSLWPHESQHARPPGPSPTPGDYSNSCPSSR